MMAKMLNVIFFVFISSSAANNDVNNDIVEQSEMKNGANSTQGDRGDGRKILNQKNYSTFEIKHLIYKL